MFDLFDGGSLSLFSCDIHVQLTVLTRQIRCIHMWCSRQLSRYCVIDFAEAPCLLGSCGSKEAAGDGYLCLDDEYISQVLRKCNQSIKRIT